MPRKYLIEGLLPERELSLLAGPSGGNKTTWLFQAIELWLSSQPIHGHATHPCPWVYVSADRSCEAANATIERVGIDPNKVPLISGVEDALSSFESIVKAARDKDPKVKLIVIDGFATTVPGGKTNDYQTVANHLKNVTRFCKKHDMTILGIIHAAKTKEGEKYLNPRERILGSVAWAGFSETIFFMEPIDAADSKNNYRRLDILPRNAPNERYEFQLDNKGRLVPSTERFELDKDCEFFLDSVGEAEFDVDEMAAGLKIRRTKAYKVIEQLVENNAIRKVRRGVYQRIESAFFGPN